MAATDRLSAGLRDNPILSAVLFANERNQEKKDRAVAEKSAIVQAKREADKFDLERQKSIQAIETVVLDRKVDAAEFESNVVTRALNFEIPEDENGDFTVASPFDGNLVTVPGDFILESRKGLADKNTAITRLTQAGQAERAATTAEAKLEKEALDRKAATDAAKLLGQNRLAVQQLRNNAARAAAQLKQSELVGITPTIALDKETGAQALSELTQLDAHMAGIVLGQVDGATSSTILGQKQAGTLAKFGFVPLPVKVKALNIAIQDAGEFDEFISGVDRFIEITKDETPVVADSSGFSRIKGEFVKLKGSLVNDEANEIRKRLEGKLAIIKKASGETSSVLSDRDIARFEFLLSNRNQTLSQKIQARNELATSRNNALDNVLGGISPVQREMIWKDRGISRVTLLGVRNIESEIPFDQLREEANGVQ